MKQRCVILSASEFAPLQMEQILPTDYLIACDAGYLQAQQYGRTPDLILGDFDSAPLPNAQNVLQLPAEKDDTDTHYAAKIAVEKGFSSVLMLGAWGGSRLEHSLANLATGLWLAKQNVEVSLATSHSTIRFLLANNSLQLPYAPNEYFSLFPLEGAATGITLIGAKYPLKDATLSPAFPLGVSNETTKSGTTILLATGALAVVCTKKEK